MLFLIVLMFSLVAGQYVRELQDFKEQCGYDDVNKLSSLLQKEPEIRTIAPESCTSSKCRIKLSETFNMVVDKGYGISLKLTHTGLMNTTIDAFMRDVNYNVSASYLYTTPMTKIYYRIAFKNYNEKKYSDCLNNVGTDDFTTISDVMISGQKGKDWDFAVRTSKSIDIGPLSADAVKCGHYWPTTLTTCVEKAAIVRLDEGIALFKLDNEVELDFTLEAQVFDKISQYHFSGDFNQPQIWSVNDNLNIEVNPVGTVLNPENNYVACLFKKITELTFKCYHMENAPELGSLSNTGIGKFQLVNLNSPEKLLMDKTAFLTDAVYACNDNKIRKSKYSDDAVNTLRSKVFELYDMKKSDQQVDKKVLDFTNMTYQVQLGDTCCVKVVSPTDLFLENSVASLSDVREVYKSKMLSDIAFIDISTGYPRLDKLNFKKLIRKPILVSLLSDGLDIGFDIHEYEVSNGKIPRMVYYQDAAGSYFNLEFDYTGQPQNIKIDSEDINILTKEIYVHKSGKVEEQVGFKSKGLLKNTPKICIGTNKMCLKPEIIDNKSPKDGMIDDNEIDDGAYYSRASDFLVRLFTSNWILTSLSCILSVIELICTLVVATMIYKITRKFFTVLCCAAAMKEGNAFITDRLFGKFDDVQMEIGKYEIKDSVATVYGFSKESTLLNGIIDNENGFNTLTCATTSLVEAEDIYCDGYCFVKPLVRDIIITKKSGNIIYDGQMWSSGIIDVYESAGKIHVRNNKKLYLNESVIGSKDCRDLWNKAMSEKQSIKWLKETVLPGYVSQFGYSTLKLQVVGKGGDIMLFEVADRMTLYDGFDVLSMRKFGYTNSIHAVEVTIVADNSLSQDDRLDDLRRAISLPANAIIHSVQSQPGQFISRHFYLIQCEERCSVMDPTHEGKAKEITINKYYQIVDNGAWMRKASSKIYEMCKDINSVRNISVELADMTNWTVGGKELTHLKLTDDKTTMLIAVRHFNRAYDSSCNLKIKFSKVFQNSIFHSNFLITNDGVFKVKRGGPIAINCINTGLGSRCKHLNNEMTAFINEGTNEVSLKSIKYKGIIYSYAIGDYVEHISPVEDDCKGKLFVDQNSLSSCSHDCCLISNDYWQSFNLMKSSSRTDIGRTAVLSQWSDNKRIVYNVKPSGWCDYNGFVNSVKCLVKDHWEECLFCVCFPIGLLLFYYLVIAIYYTIIWCVSSRPMRDIGYLKRRRYGRKWFFTNMAENIMKGKPKFWKYSKIDDNDDEYYRDTALKPVYRRTVKPII